MPPNSHETRVTDSLVLRKHADEPELRTYGSVPWALQGMHLTLDGPAPTETGASVLLQVIDLTRDQRVAYRGGRVAITSESLKRRLLTNDRPSQAAQAFRIERQILLNIPSYGLIAVSSDLSSAWTQQRVSEGEVSLLGAGYVTAIVSSDELICQIGHRAPLHLRLGDSLGSLRQLGVAGHHVVATALVPGDGDSESGRLGVALLRPSEHFRWYPIELARIHQLLAVQHSARSLSVWISESPSLSAASRIRAWSIHERTGDISGAACYTFDARGPFAFERAGEEPACIYGLQPSGRDSAGALAQLNLSNGKTAVDPCAFGTRVGLPVIASERGGRRSWLLVTTHDSIRDRTELAIREVHALSRAPVAHVQLPLAFELGSESVWG